MIIVPAAPRSRHCSGEVAVSYTHLDVYKRQALALLADPGEEGPPLAGVGEGLRHWDGSARVVPPIEPVAG